MSVTSSRAVGRPGPGTSSSAPGSAAVRQRSLPESLALIAAFHRDRMLVAVGVPFAAVLLGVALQELASKHGELGVGTLVALTLAGVAALGVAVVRPVLPLLACTIVSFSSSSALLHAHYGLPVLAKYLPLLLLAVIAVHWTRRTGSELIPSALRLPARTTGPIPASFPFCLSLLALVHLLTHASVLYAADQGLAADELAGQGRDLLLALALALSIGRLGRWSALPAVCTIALHSITAVTLVAIVASFHPQLEHVLPGFAFVYDGDQPEETAVRIAGAFGHPNSLGRYAVFMMPVAVCLIAFGRGAVRASAVPCLLVLLAGVVLSESRGALLVLGLISLPALFVAIRTVRPRYWLPALVVGALVVGASWQHVNTERMTRSVQDAQRFVEAGDMPTDGATRGRLSEMRVAYELWRAHPYLGVGLASYEHHFQTYSYDLGTKLYNDDRAAHSLYLELLAERGIVGLIGFVLAIAGIVLTVLYHGLGRLHDRPGIHARLMIAMVVSAVAYYLSAVLLHDVHSTPIWALLGIMIGSLGPAAPEGKERRTADGAGKRIRQGTR